MIKTVLFDLDGTLLPMDQEIFVKSYLSRLAAAMIPHGYDPKLLVKSIWAGTAAMVKNNGTASNEDVFWTTCNAVYGKNVRRDEAKFDAFYRMDFQSVREDCGFDPRAAETVRALHRMGLATNPLFPAVATYSRTRWAGLSAEDFLLITTYETSSHCKPNPDYYREILGKLNLKPEECLMVGNDVDEDLIAEELGMRVFLLTDCLINKSGKDIAAYPHGSFPELLTFIRGLL